jgi:D-alanyl-D-alanine carboxypeptidase (penicillin-binding protein 5/6)
MCLSLKKLSLFVILLAYFSFAPAAPPLPAPPKVNAKAHLLMDYHSGLMLAENNIDAPLEPASLTKIMTVYVLANELKEGNISLVDEVMVSEKAWRMSGSRTFIEINKKIPLKTLLMGVIIQSGNDASVALAEHTSGSEDVFVELMNQQAERLGLKGTHFVNCTGLPDPNHYTTARDLATLAKALIRDFPDTYAYSKMREFTFNGIVQHNRNRLLWQDESVDGLKTGHTETAGFCLVASAERNDMRLISVVLGSTSEGERATATQALLNYGFRFYETHRLYGANQPLTQVRVWKGQADQADLGLSEELYVTIPRRQYKELNAVMDLESSVMAPVEKGQAKGTLKISIKGKEVAQRPLVALQSVGEGGFVHRMMDDLRMLWQ